MNKLVNVSGRTFDLTNTLCWGNQFWKLIPCDGIYWISTKGNVWSVDSQRYLKPYCDGRYWAVSLPFGDKYKKQYIHRLVAAAFIPEIPEKNVVNHIDECKEVNFALNLEWVTPKENVNHGTRTARAAETLRRKRAEKAMS